MGRACAIAGKLLREQKIKENRKMTRKFKVEVTHSVDVVLNEQMVKDHDGDVEGAVLSMADIKMMLGKSKVIASNIVELESSYTAYLKERRI